MSNQNVLQPAENGNSDSKGFYRPLDLQQKLAIHKAIIGFWPGGTMHAPRLLALHLLHFYHNETTGMLCPSQQTLGTNLGISERAVRDHISILRKHRIIETKQAALAAGGFNMYRFNFPGQWLGRLGLEAELPEAQLPATDLPEARPPEAELPGNITNIDMIEDNTDIPSSSSIGINVRTAPLRGAQEIYRPEGWAEPIRAEAFAEQGEIRTADAVRACDLLLVGAAPIPAPVAPTPDEGLFQMTDTQLRAGAEAIKNLVKDKGMLKHPLVAIDAGSWKANDVVQMIGLFNGHYRMGLPVCTDENADLFRPALRAMQEVLTGKRPIPPTEAEKKAEREKTVKSKRTGEAATEKVPTQMRMIDERTVGDEGWNLMLKAYGTKVV